MTQRYDLLIIGAGPAGLTAAIYASRARLRTLVVDEGLPGGQVKTTHKVSNYPGFPEDVKGADLAVAFATQAQRFGAEIRRAVEITRHDLGGALKTLELDEEETVEAPAVIVATGARPRPLGIPGETEFKGRGLSYCATCDGAYFEGKDIHVIGGGTSAVEEALFLTRFAKTVTIVHRGGELRAEPTAVEEAHASPKIRLLARHVPRAFLGGTALDRIEVEDLETGERRTLHSDGAFVFIGLTPRTDLLRTWLPVDAQGYVVTGEDMSTAVPGLYVAGDIRAKEFRQITTAVADGTIAALAAQKFLKAQAGRAAKAPAPAAAAV
jgi:thioredoxin reductase (NADPH)